MINVSEGDRFGLLTIIKEVEKFVQPSGQTQRGFLCKCDCGNKNKVRLSHLRQGRVKSCGCLQGEHHDEYGKPLHNTWRGMRNRVKKYHSESHLYYDRGITVCDEWDNSYLAFKKWAKKNNYKEGLTIDRIDNDKGYYPDNCRFVTQKVNNANRRNTVMVNYKGEEIAFSILIDNKGLNKHSAAIRARLRRGWDVEDAFDKPIRKGNYRRKTK